MVCKNFLLFLLLLASPVLAVDLDRLGCSDKAVPYKLFGQWQCFEIDLSSIGGGCTADDKVGVGNGTTTDCVSLPDSDATTLKLQYDTSTNAFSAGTDQVGYDEILDEGSGLTKRPKINFIGSSIAAVDNSGSTRTDVTVTAYNTVADEGSGLTQRPTINFSGFNVACIDNSGSTRTDCQIGSGNGGEGPPWGVPFRHHFYLKFSQASESQFNWGGEVADFQWTRDSGAGALSVNPVKGHVYANNSTTTGTASGFRMNTASANGYCKFNERPVAHYNVAVIDSAGSDSTIYKFFASIENGVSGLPIAYTVTQARTCVAGNTTVTNGGAGIQGVLMICWDRAAQANIQCCRGTEVDTGGGGNQTQQCTDTGIAIPTSGTSLDIALDFYDSANPKCWIDGTAITVTGNLPTNVNRMVQNGVGMRATSASTDLETIVYNAEEWCD